jgi:hypothetical protein
MSLSLQLGGITWEALGFGATLVHSSTLALNGSLQHCG